MRIDLTVNGKGVSLDVPPLRRLIDILREDLRLTGTKEGCGEGECGACAVLLDGQLVNSCLVPALQLSGCRIVTIEGLGTEQNPDPLQTAFMEEGAVQCGFCTPGMVLAARALLDRCPQPGREEIREALAGNLCRCTGYGQIVTAIERAAGAPAARAPGDAGARRSSPLSPSTLREALEVLEEGKNRVTIVSGATDLMANLKLGLPRPGRLLDITRIGELIGVARAGGRIEIGSGTTLDAIASDPILVSDLPALVQAARLFAAPAIRNRATLGGNLLSASPAADLPPVLLALDATIVLASRGGVREIAIDSFFTGYRETARRPEELLLHVRVPLPAGRTRQAFYKIGTRRAQSIAKVSIAGRVRVESDGILREVRIAAGSVAPTPILLQRVGRELEGQRLDPNRIDRAGGIASSEAAPIDDVRSSAHYRRVITGRLIRRFLREIMGR